MSNKYVWAGVSSAAALIATAVTVGVVRRSRREPPPISATVPRVEDLRTVTDGGDPDSAAS
ncbi:hypothetical protein VX037_08790 [Gordonia sp. Z-3]|jgi:hypothetical protein|uniref:Uncharacterized protein n=1 Tax=Gordonia tangerina TaxID=2911060 RepID=A0ABS9DCE8_9ACTN|nr:MULTISPECIES: hypothetical protein [Gordonia]MAU82974.1 hypothetical protein [Gordonia sp. (in: high G+C Gram-positive bacteria)]MCF3936861.1 hypothetical protein [Gordonia tangerina]MED5801117.1 hypothetical protein [Gordonia sp. Z-3]